MPVYPFKERSSENVQFIDTALFLMQVSSDVYLRAFIISAVAAFSYLITTPIIECIGKRTFASKFSRHEKSFKSHTYNMRLEPISLHA